MFDWLIRKENPYAVSGLARNKKARQYLRGDLQTLDDELVLRSRYGSAALPLKGLVIQRNRWLGGPIRFTHPDQPGWMLQTPSLKIFDDPNFGGGGRFKARYCVHFAYTRQALKLGLLAALLGFIFVPAFRNTVTGSTVALIPTQDDVYVGEEVYGLMRPGLNRVSDPLVVNDVRQIFGRLTDAVPVPEHHFNFQIDVVLDPTVNAFALPGGHVVVNSGLILETQNADELAGVLGHELGHVTRRHAMRNYVAEAGVWALMQQLVGHSHVARIAARYSRQLAGMKFSRDDESEADQMGWQYVRRAHFATAGLEHFFARLADHERSEQESADVEYLLRSHPLSQERAMTLHALSAEAATDPHIQSAGFDYAELQARVQELQLQRIPKK